MTAPAAPSPPSSARQEAAHAALDLLATMVAIVTPAGECEFANTSFESVLGFVPQVRRPEPHRKEHAAQAVDDFAQRLARRQLAAAHFLRSLLRRAPALACDTKPRDDLIQRQRDRCAVQS